MAKPEEPTTTRPREPAAEAALGEVAVEPDGSRAAHPPVPKWVWVTIALLVVVLGLGLAALSFQRSGEASGKALADVQQLMDELTTLNSSLATTNAILANAIQSSSQLSAKANAKLGQVSANVAGLKASIGQARATIGPQLSDTVRTRLANAETKLQARVATLAQHQGQLSQQALIAAQASVALLTSQLEAVIQSGNASRTVLQGQINDLLAQVDLQASAQDRLTTRLGNASGTIGTIKSRVQGRVSSLRDRVSGLRDQVAAERDRLLRLVLLVQRLRARLDQLGPR